MTRNSSNLVKICVVLTMAMEVVYFFKYFLFLFWSYIYIYSNRSKKREKKYWKWNRSKRECCPPAPHFVSLNHCVFLETHQYSCCLRRSDRLTTPPHRLSLSLSPFKTTRCCKAIFHFLHSTPQKGMCPTLSNRRTTSFSWRNDISPTKACCCCYSLLTPSLPFQQSLIFTVSVTSYRTVDFPSWPRRNGPIAARRHNQPAYGSPRPAGQAGPALGVGDPPALRCF